MDSSNQQKLPDRQDNTPGEGVVPEYNVPEHERSSSNTSNMNNELLNHDCDDTSSLATSDANKRALPNSNNNDGDDTATTTIRTDNENQQQHNKRRKKGNHNHHHRGRGRRRNDNNETTSGKNTDPRLNESTTVDDISDNMDAASYLAWVNRQANSLPNVFVSNQCDDDDDDDDTKEIAAEGGESKNDSNISNNNNKSNNEKACQTKATTPSSKEDDEEQDDPIHGSPIHGSAATLQVLLSKRMDILPPPTVNHLPPRTTANANYATLDEEKAQSSSSHDHGWVYATISNFSKLRTYLEKEAVIQKQQRSNTNTNHRKIAVPRMKDRAAWHVFCLGKEEAYGNVGGYYQEDDSEAEEEGNNSKDVDLKNGTDNRAGAGAGAATNRTIHPTTTTPKPNQPTSKLIYNPSTTPPTGHAPTTSLLLQLDQVLTRTLFHHHVDYLCEWKCPLTPSRSRWIYACLARMEKPWHREECCAVRRVLRECCERRWELKMTTATDLALVATAPRSSSSVVGSSSDRDVGGGDGDNEAMLVEIGCGGKNEKEEEGDTSTKKAREQLAMLNTLIAVTGIYYEQGAIAGGDGIDSLFTVGKKS